MTEKYVWGKAECFRDFWKRKAWQSSKNALWQLYLEAALWALRASPRSYFFLFIKI